MGGGGSDWVPWLPPHVSKARRGAPFAGFLEEFLLVGIQGEGTVVSHISRKTSEMWGTRQVPPLRSHGTPGQAG
jgi:hypothetical protein